MKSILIVLNVIVRFLTVIFALNVAQSYIDIANAASFISHMIADIANVQDTLYLLNWQKNH